MCLNDFFEPVEVDNLELNCNAHSESMVLIKLKCRTLFKNSVYDVPVPGSINDNSKNGHLAALTAFLHKIRSFEKLLVHSSNGNFSAVAMRMRKCPSESTHLLEYGRLWLFKIFWCSRCGKIGRLNDTLHKHIWSVIYRRMFAHFWPLLFDGLTKVWAVFGNRPSNNAPLRINTHISSDHLFMNLQHFVLCNVRPNV